MARPAEGGVNMEKSILDYIEEILGSPMPNHITGYQAQALDATPNSSVFAIMTTAANWCRPSRLGGKSLGVGDRAYEAQLITKSGSKSN